MPATFVVVEYRLAAVPDRRPVGQPSGGTLGQLLGCRGLMLAGARMAGPVQQFSDPHRAEHLLPGQQHR
jgi:hypothetical protein